MTIEGFPTHCIFYGTEFFDLMIDDYKHSTTIIHSEVSYFNELLLDLSSHFAERNLTLSSFGFPEPDIVNTELEREFLKYDTRQQSALLNSLHLHAPNNSEQLCIYNVISHCVKKNKEIFSSWKRRLWKNHSCQKTNGVYA